MAIDTEAKRRSVAGIPFLSGAPSVTPSLSKNAAWRQQVSHSYYGILAQFIAPQSLLLLGGHLLGSLFGTSVASGNLFGMSIASGRLSGASVARGRLKGN